MAQKSPELALISTLCTKLQSIPNLKEPTFPEDDLMARHEKRIPCVNKKKVIKTKNLSKGKNMKANREDIIHLLFHKYDF